MPIGRARLRISDYTEKRARQLKKHEKRIAQASLSLTSMVDMFAILVIFLLTNTSTVAQWVEVGHGIELPKSKTSDPPPRAAVIELSRQGIYGDKKLLGSANQVLHGGETLSALRNWLGQQSKKDGHVNIVADEKLDFGIIKRVISVSQEAGFKNVNLAVQPKL
jgi:biopolymer transport protein ExbD